MVIKIARYYSYPDIKRQSPGCQMKWKDFIFTEDDVEQCDYLVILDYPKNDFTLKVNPDNILHLCLEPPNEVSKYRQFGNKNVSLIYNQMDINKNNILSHGALPWHVDKDFDYLSSLDPHFNNKKNHIVWVTSNQSSSQGHSARMNFLNSIKNTSGIKIFGRGIKPINDKWDVLSKSKYAIAYENFTNDYYWTEKISDCFLSYTMPIYFGCNNIQQFFPRESFIQLDPKDKHISLFFKELLKSNKWEESLEAIKSAREMILFQYQLFPFLFNQIKALQSARGISLEGKKLIKFKGGDAYFDNYPIQVKFEKEIYKIKRKLRL